MLTWLVAAAAAAGLVGLGRRVLAGYPPAPSGLSSLSRGEYAAVAAAALAVFPPGGAIAASGLDAGVPAHADRFLAAQPRATRRLMRLLFLLVEHATILFPAPGAGGRRRFSSLSPEQRAQVLDGWQRSRLFPRRLVFTSLRAILTIGYFTDPGVLRGLGLAPRAIAPRTCEADFLWPAIGEPPSSIPSMALDPSPPAPARPLGPRGPLHPDYDAAGSGGTAR